MAFEKAELSKRGRTELPNYESSLKIYRDLKGAKDTAHDKGKIEGKIANKIDGKIECDLERILKVANTMKEEGFSVNEMARLTSLS